MRRAIVALVLAVLAGTSVAACSGVPASSGGGAAAQESVSTAIKQSPDKYTWYMKDYVGMNAASVGYEALDGFRHDAYGSGNIKVIYVAPDGAYVDPGNEEQLKEYVVVGQSVDPNTEMKYEYELDDEGEEYDNLINFQTIEEIVLAVDKVGSNAAADSGLTQIQASPDKYTHYVRDYVGRNLAECGYYSLSGNLTDSYGHGYVFFDIVTDDGSFVDPEDKAQLAEYMVTSQSVEPNTEITMTYMADDDGAEYSNLIDSQSIESITLNVTKAPESGYPVGDAGDGEAVESTDSANTADEEGASGASFRELMDNYETFIDEYVDFMTTYASSDDTSGMLSDYADMMARYSEMAEQVDEIDEGALSADDYAYYIEVMGRVTARLAEIGQ